MRQKGRENVPNLCIKCGHKILRDAKFDQDNWFHSSCHRDYITNLFDGLVAVLPDMIRYYFSLSGADREIYREDLRGTISAYRELSY